MTEEPPGGSRPAEDKPDGITSEQPGTGEGAPQSGGGAQTDAASGAPPTPQHEAANGLVGAVPEFTPSDADSNGEAVISTLDAPPSKEPYNPQKKLDEVRARLAFRPVWVLVGVIAAGVLLLATVGWTDVDRFPDLRQTFELVFSGILTLVSTATGFYFGQRSTTGTNGG